MTQTEKQKNGEVTRHLYLSQKALMGETTEEEDKELEELEKIAEEKKG